MNEPIPKIVFSPNMQAASSESNAEHKLKLQRENNFVAKPGRHTLDSAVVASRVTEIELIKSKQAECPELVDFEKALYKPENIFLIPQEKSNEAEEIAKRRFSEYVEKYSDNGATINNVVQWAHTGMPGAGSNKMHIYDTENEWNTWTLHAVVEDQGGIRGNFYLPKYVVAFHELMHVEETPKGVPESYEQGELSELLTTVKTILLQDEVYKEIYNIPVETEVDYRRDITWKGRQVAIGGLANFYRNLEEKYDNIGLALSSKESLDYISGVNKESEASLK